MRRHLIMVSTLTGIAQAAGFFKLWLTARLFGVGAELDGYYLALVAPTLVSGVLGGVLQTALFPVRAKLAVEKDSEVVQRFERGVLAILFALSLVIAGTVFMAGPQLIAWGSNHITLSVHETAMFVLPFAVILIPLNAVGDSSGYLLAMRNRYPIAAAAPIANALLGSTLLAFWPEGGLLNLVLGTVIGVALQVTICLIALARTGFSAFGVLPARGEMKEEWQAMLRLSIWVLPAVIFSNLTATLPIVLIAAHGEGAVSAFGYAWRFYQYAIQLLIMAASSVLLAHFSQLVAVGDELAIRMLLRKAVWLSAALGLLSTTGIALIGKPVLELIFSGRFDAVAAAMVAQHWLWLTFALGPALLGNVYAKVWQARARPGFMSLLAALGLAVFLFSNLLLEKWLGPYAVAAAIGLSSLAVMSVGWQAAWYPRRLK